MIPTPSLLSKNALRISVRNVQINLEKIEDKAMDANKKRYLEGITSPSNSFVVLSDNDIMLRTIKWV